VLLRPCVIAELTFLRLSCAARRRRPEAGKTGEPRMNRHTWVGQVLRPWRAS